MIHSTKDPSSQKRGEELIQSGKVGALILAGGQATRLKFDRPKGLFPVTPVKKRTLFQLLLERAAAKAPGSPVAIMTSALTHDKTASYLEENHFFGAEVDLIQQSSLPFLDEEKREIQSIPKAPEGNGEAIELFYKTLYPSWKKRGIEYLSVVLVDNALADPFDPELIGTLAASQASILAKAVKRRDPEEKVGLFFFENDLVFVKEYSELTEKEKAEDHPFANISTFAVKTEAIPLLATVDLPIHLVKKRISSDPNSPLAFKQERFIFDLFPYTKTEILVSPREECFAPLKNSEGEDSLKAVQEALLNRDRKRFRELYGKEPDNAPFELSEEEHVKS